MYIPEVTSDELLLGVYVNLPQPWSAFISNKRMEIGDSLAENCAPHITLLPPTPVAKSQLNTFLKDLKHIADTSKSFWVGLDSSSNFLPVSTVSFIKVSYGYDECKVLHDKIYGCVENASPRFPFHPHVTLAHNISVEKIRDIQSDFSDFKAAFICSNIFVDVLDTKGNSHTVIVLPFAH